MDLELEKDAGKNIESLFPSRKNNQKMESKGLKQTN